MISGNRPFFDRAGEPVSRRTAVFELAGMALVLAIPVGAMMATAKPIPDPPSRKALNFAPLANPVAEQQQRKAKKEKRRSDKKQRKDKNRRGSQQRARDESQSGSRNKEEQPSDAEQRDSQP